MVKSGCHNRMPPVQMQRSPANADLSYSDVLGFTKTVTTDPGPHIEVVFASALLLSLPTTQMSTCNCSSALSEH